MHMMDCKDSAALSFGGARAFLLQDDRLGDNRAQRLATINARRIAHYARRPGVARLPKVLLGNVYNDGWADLHGPAFKAAITRQAAPFFNELLSHYCSSDEPLDECLRLNMASLDDMYNLLYSMSLFPSDADLIALRTAVQSYGTSYQRLRELARRRRIQAFPVRPKVHKSQHISFLAECINPTAIQCYSEESQMGIVSKTWKGSVRGCYRDVVQRNVLVKRLTALLLRFELVPLPHGFRR